MNFARLAPIGIRSALVPQRWPLIWRLLGVFWCVVLAGAGMGIATLAYLGPPEEVTSQLEQLMLPPADVPAAPVVAEVAKPVTVVPAAKPVATPITAPPPPAAIAATGSIAAPDPALLEASNLYPGGLLPKIGADHRTPMQAYAAPFNAADPRPRVALLMAGIGMNEAESAVAIANLPAAISLAVTPYAARLDSQIANARVHGHEFLISIPMEPQGFPLNDPGYRGLLTGASLATNAQLLEWSLVRFTGYVGATGALGEMRGERFAAASDQMAPLLATLAGRGLLYIDPRPNAITSAWLRNTHATMRGVDEVIDDPAGAAEIDRALAQLEQTARDRGSALGLAGRPSPVTIDRINAWAVGLAARGVVLAPVSAVVQTPRAPPPLVKTNVSK
jgi:polysaccharide deacetylase 2 family uncharacterized protein YibQ